MHGVSRDLRYCDKCQQTCEHKREHLDEVFKCQNCEKNAHARKGTLLQAHTDKKKRPSTRARNPILSALDRSEPNKTKGRPAV